MVSLPQTGSLRRKALWAFAVSVACGGFWSGCKSSAPAVSKSPTPPVAVTVPAPTASVPTAPVAAPEPLPHALGRERLTESLVESLRKRVMGRREALKDVERVVTQIGPIVAAAARQPQVEGFFQQMAADRGVSKEETRARWIALQEADILLESGGNPDARSPSDAIGAAQWLAGTANANGLPVNLKESRRLTRKIEPLRLRVAWLEYLTRPDADPHAPGAPALSREAATQQLPAVRAELEMLRAKRRRVDGRYDPQKALFAQTRYLLALYPKIPAEDWLFQAYHGGVAGAQRLLKRYLGNGWPGSLAAAIRSGANGHLLTFEEVYFATTPRSRPEAFAYLYGRSDDHRYYWWKLRAAQEALARYRRDPAAFRQEWERLLPGRRMEAVWYPNAPAEAFADLVSLRDALQSRRLVPVGARAEYAPRSGLWNWLYIGQCAALRPEAKGALDLVATVYRHAGGAERLSLGDLTFTRSYEQQAKALLPPLPPRRPLWPPDPDAHTLPGGGPPPDFDFHLTGLAFDILRPPAPMQRKILEYAMGDCADRQILAWSEHRDRGARRYHVVPNPRYAAALAALTLHSTPRSARGNGSPRNSPLPTP